MTIGPLLPTSPLTPLDLNGRASQGSQSPGYSTSGLVLLQSILTQQWLTSLSYGGCSQALLHWTSQTP